VVSKIGVPGAGEIEQLKLLIAYLKALSPYLACVGSAPLTMIWIGIFILPFAVVKERKEADDDDISAGACG
jgi:hypothetical protein